MSSSLWLLCVLGTALCWGSYGPVVHIGQAALKSPWKAYLFVGVAYFPIAVIIPLIILKLGPEGGYHFNARGTVFSLLTGALGALGAFFVILAMRTGGKPLYVMPLIFGLAPVTNVVVSSILHPPEKAIHPMLYAGIVILATGAGMVLYFKPS